VVSPPPGQKFKIQPPPRGFSPPLFFEGPQGFWGEAKTRNRAPRRSPVHPKRTSIPLGAQAGQQRGRNFFVQEKAANRSSSSINVVFHAQRGKHARVLATNDAAPATTICCGNSRRSAMLSNRRFADARGKDRRPIGVRATASRITPPVTTSSWLSCVVGGRCGPCAGRPTRPRR